MKIIFVIETTLKWDVYRRLYWRPLWCREKGKLRMLWLAWACSVQWGISAFVDTFCAGSNEHEQA